MKNSKKTLSLVFLTIITFIIFLFYFYKHKKSISIMAFNCALDINLIKQFEEETGIKVNIKYFSSNEELVAKLSISNKNIDLLFPSDYVIAELLKLKLIKPLDIKKIDCFPFIIKELLTPVHCNKKYYGIPLEWGVFGLVVNEKIKKNITNNNDIYKAFFEGTCNDLALRIATINDIPTVCNITYYYYQYFFKKNKIYYKKNLFTILYEILKKQRHHVVVYTDESVATLFKDDIIDVALMQTYRYLKIIEQYPELNLEFIFPTYHILQATDYCTLSSSSEKEDLCYEFINFLFEKNQLSSNLKEHCLFSPRTDLLDETSTSGKQILSELKKNKKIIQLTETILNQKDMTALWMKLKST
jgi:spermidine/putrescine transport system substrate-binding protein